MPSVAVAPDVVNDDAWAAHVEQSEPAAFDDNDGDDDEDDGACEDEVESQEIATLGNEKNALTKQLEEKLDSNIGHGTCGRVLVRMMHPPLRVELGLKIAWTLLLYGVAIGLMVHLTVWSSTHPLDRMGDGRTLKLTVESPKQLKVKLTACVLHVTSTEGTAVHFTDTTGGHDRVLDKFGGFHTERTHISMRPVGGDCLVIRCVGPSRNEGYLTTAHLEIGADAAIAGTAMEAISVARSTAVLTGANYGQRLTIVGEAVLTQLIGVRVDHLRVDIESGMVDIRRSWIEQAAVKVDSAPVSVALPEDGTVELRVDSEVALCLSDAAGVPVGRNGTTGRLAFRFGSGQVANVVDVTRHSPDAQVFVSRGVSQANRSQRNTHDSTARVGFVPEAMWHTWAEDTAAAGFQVLRFRAIGPGMDDLMADPGKRGEWVYAVHGDVYMWHPASLFWIFTWGFFFPLAAREEILLASSRCVPFVSVEVAGDECTLDVPDTTTTLSTQLGAVHSALWYTLAPTLRMRNATLAELYFVQSPSPVETGSLGFLSSIADGNVTKFMLDAKSAQSLIQFTAQGKPSEFMNASSVAFVVLGFFVAILGPCMVTLLLMSGYMRKRDEVVKAQKKKLLPKLVFGYLAKAKGKAKPGLAASKLSPKHTSPVQDPHGAWGITQPGAQEQTESAQAAPAEADAGQAEASLPWHPNTPLFKTAVHSVELCGALRNISVRKQLERTVNKLIDNGVHIFSLLDAMVLNMWPGVSQSDGLPAALVSVSIHFTLVMSGCLPTFCVAFLQYHNSVYMQAECASNDLVQGNWGLPSRTTPTCLVVLMISAVCFMLVLAVVEYLARQAHLLVHGQGRRAGKRAAKLRRRLLRFRAYHSIRFSFVFYMASTILGTSFFGILFIMYILLGACVVPAHLVPILLSIAAIFFVARTTFQSLLKLQEALKGNLESMRNDLKDTVELAEAVEEVLRDLGFDSAQIVLITVVVCVQFSALVAFVLIGCRLFLSPSSVVTSLISSSTVVLGAVTSVRSGELPKDYVKKTHATMKLNASLERVQAFSASYTRLAESKGEDMKEKLSATQQVYDITHEHISR